MIDVPRKEIINVLVSYIALTCMQICEYTEECVPMKRAQVGLFIEDQSKLEIARFSSRN